MPIPRKKKYANVQVPLNDCDYPQKYGLKFAQELTKRISMVPYVVLEDLHSFEYNEKIV